MGGLIPREILLIIKCLIKTALTSTRQTVGSQKLLTASLQPSALGLSKNKCHHGCGKCPSWAGKSRAALFTSGGWGLRRVWCSVSKPCASETPLWNQWDVQAGSCTWHFPSWLIWQTQILVLLPLNLFYSMLTADFAVRKTVGFVPCWAHKSEGTISTASKASIKSGLRLNSLRKSCWTFSLGKALLPERMLWWEHCIPKPNCPWNHFPLSAS